MFRLIILKRHTATTDNEMFERVKGQTPSKRGRRARHSILECISQEVEA